MSQNGHDAYLEGRILSADPLELVRLLYQGCDEAVREARQRLADGDITGRSCAISNACEILTELMTSLDRERGGDISRNLERLYDYMQRRLIDANIQQADAPLAEVLGLLTTLAEGWSGVQAQARPSAAASGPREQPPARQAEPIAETSPWGQPFRADSEPVAYAPYSPAVAETNPWGQPFGADREPVAYTAYSSAAAEMNPWGQPFRTESEPVAYTPYTPAVAETNPWGQPYQQAEPVADALSRPAAETNAWDLARLAQAVANEQFGPGGAETNPWGQPAADEADANPYARSRLADAERSPWGQPLSSDTESAGSHAWSF